MIDPGSFSQSGVPSIEELQKHFQMLMRGVTEYAIIVTDPAGKVVDWSVGAEQIIGYSRDEVTGQSVRIIFTAEDRTNQVPEHEMVTARATGRAGDDRWLAKKDGSRFRASGVLTAIQGTSGEATGFVKILRDVTEEIRLQESLQSAQRAESVAALAAGVAHRFNNLLTSILGHTSLVMDHMPDASVNRHMLQQVMEAGEAAAELTAQLIAYAGKAHLFKEPVNLSGMIQSRMGLLRSVMRGKELQFELDEQVPDVDGDAGQLEQVVVNLVINASEATGIRDAAVRVATAECALGWKEIEAMDLAEVTPGRFVSCTVTDAGCGMDADTLKRIFDPFFSTKFLGRGLGLAAVLGIVRQHKGAVYVTSELGVGSRFVVYLPVVGS